LAQYSAPEVLLYVREKGKKVLDNQVDDKDEEEEELEEETVDDGGVAELKASVRDLK